MSWYQSNEAMRVFMEIRKMKGRTHVHIQRDATTGKWHKRFCPDPILWLYAARSSRMQQPANYGEIRQRVVSPVPLPDLRK